MNLLNKCTKGEIELIEKAGIILEDKDYNEEELKICGSDIIEYIMQVLCIAFIHLFIIFASCKIYRWQNN